MEKIYNLRMIVNVFQENYGKHDKACVQRITDLFREMGLPEEYDKYEMACYESLMEKIKGLPSTIPQLFFKETADLIIKRDK